MQARRLTMSAFPGGAAAATLLLTLLCAPDANASKSGPDCPHEAAERPPLLDVADSELDSRFIEPGRSLEDHDPAATDTGAEFVPPSPEFETVMTRILEASAANGADEEQLAADDTDSSPVAEADVDAGDRAPGDTDWASESARLPGLSEAAAERYRRQMYRTDI